MDMVTKRAPVGANEKGSFGNLVSNAFKRSPSFGSNKVLRECWTPRGNEEKFFPLQVSPLWSSVGSPQEGDGMASRCRECGGFVW